MDAYCDALVCGNFAERRVPPLDSRSHDSSKKLLQTIWETETGPDEVATRHNIVHDYFNWVLAYCENRTLCTTEQGLIALAPKAAQPGD